MSLSKSPSIKPFDRLRANGVLLVSEQYGV